MLTKQNYFFIKMTLGKAIVHRLKGRKIALE